MLAAHYYPSQEQPTNGEKTPWLVFLHGLLGSHDDWSSIVEACPNYPRLVVDLPGHGDSRNIGCQGFVDFDKQLTQLLAHYSASQYVLIGYSLGARLAMHFACFHSHQGLQGLVIEGGNVGLQSEQERIARADNDHRWAERFRHQPIEQVLNDWYQQAVFADLTPAQREKLVVLRSQNNPLAVADMLENTSLSKQPFLAESLKQLSVPYCYFCGEKDQKFRGVSQQYALPFTLIENAGHNAHRENPQHYAAALHYFLSHCG
ncbi:2-succinyl-6-hydroxy-2,4-cyclohexadiene-1-carboxylate synthase [Providencia alcalifaciens]|uniref:2-succinyl-6-hydroxy-2, 4-cyclohexadiene-1-carboxylate synthase n=1 Tax=Providencia alcalifaciens TaxID=126385 RepID=UPI002B05399B|nr:2-succinyl-6-hydroxy-2,4-cyclohexadiene-1-carboxylate synthase [Providencia alcalifaciens]